MNEIIKRPENLPDTIQELHKFILIVPEKLKSVRAEINAINKAGLAKGVRDQKIEEGQCIGEAILWAEAKLGAMLKPLANPTASRAGRRQLPEGITHKTSHKAQLLADNPRVIEDIIREARKNEDLPTKTAVLKIITEKKKKANAIKKDLKLKLPTGQYNIIYADPPWQYEHSISNSRKIENQYPTMTLEDICNLNIHEISAKDSILFLWATNPKLQEAMKVIELWGFNYRTNMVWVKDKIGMGYYCRGQHELLLISVKGGFPPPLPENRVSSLLTFQRKEHSKKPAEAYRLIEHMYPNGKYLELFAREKRKNWLSWGNEIENS
jgi:N6-adenosine-specific RNA methylase IME4